MLDNEQILSEIHARRARTEAKLETVRTPKQLAALLPNISTVDEKIVAALASELVQCFCYWADEKKTGGAGEGVLAAAGFEWTYHGRDAPYALGVGYQSIKPEPKMKRSKKFHWVRDDYLAGAKLDDMVFGDCGDVDMRSVCGPFYELVCGDNFDADEHREATELVENLFLLQFLASLHLAAQEAAKSEAFSTLKTTERFYLLARNHDNLGFLFAVLSK